MNQNYFFKWVSTICLFIGLLTNAQSQNAPLGAGLDGIADYTRSRWFVDVIKASRGFGASGASYNPYTGTKNAQGWPNQSFGMYIISALDAVHEPFLFGTYKLKFKGQATLYINGGGVLQNIAFDGTYTTAEVVVGTNSNAIDISVGNPVGVSDAHLISPGYDPNNYPLIRKEMAALIKKFSALRYMDWLSTNNSTVSTWSQRSVQSMPANQNLAGEGAGVPWEDIVNVANTYNKDLWINIPALADDNYIQQLAALLHATVNPGLKIYIELSNEVWNSFTFSAFSQLKSVAIAEIAAGDPDLNFNNVNNDVVWTQRKVAKRLYQISNFFKAEYGAAAINTTIRPVLAGQIYTGFIGEGLDFINKRFGLPGNYFYGASIAPYYFMARDDDPATYTKDQVNDQLEANMNSIFSQRKMDAFVGTALKYKLKALGYEGGPDTYGAKNIQAKADALNDPRTKTISKSFHTQWYKNGGDLYMFFVTGLGGDYQSPYGAWQIAGWASDTAAAQRYLAAKEMLAAPKPAATAGLYLPGTYSANQMLAYGDGYQSGTFYIKSGDELSYFVNVTAAGTYSFAINTRQTEAGNRGRLIENGVQIGSQINFSTVDHGTSNVISFNLTAGQHLLTLVFDVAPVNKMIPETIIFTNGSGGGGDTQAPTAPGTPTASNITQTSLTLNWAASSDNIGVTGYQIFRNGTSIGTTNGSTTNFNASGLTASTTYSFTVKATDAAGNLSAASGTLSATTSAAASGGPSGFTLCSSENQNCVLSGTQVIAYGANGSFNYLYSQTGSISCSNATFGDPINSVAKSCYVKSSSTSGTASNIVNYQGSAIANTVSPQIGFTTNGSILSIPFNDASAGQIFSSSNTQEQFRGGVKIDYSPSAVGNPIFTLRAATDGFEPAKFMAFVDNGTNQSKLNTVFVWTKDKFINNPSNLNVFFGNSASSSISANLQEVSGGTANFRFLIKNGSTYYISEYSTSVAGAASIASFNNSSAVGNRWAVYDPTSITIPSPLPTFSAVDFNNVQAVGLIYNGTRSQYAHGFKFNSLAVNALTASADTQAPTAPGTPTASNIAPTTLTLNWAASTDNVAVTSYQVFRAGVSIGTTAGLTFNATGLTAATTYSFTIKAKDAAGNVSAASGALSVTTAANVVIANIVNFQGSAITSTVSPQNGFTTSGSVLSIPFNDAVSGQLFSTTNTQQQFRGGVKIDYTPSAVGSPIFGLRAANDGFEPAKFMAYVDNSTNTSKLNIVYVWTKDKFLNNTNGGTVSFNTSSSTIAANLIEVSPGTAEYRFVIKNGSTYYISEYSALVAGVASISGFNNSSTVGKRWAAFNATTLAIPSPLPAFTAVNFDNVQAVGLIYNGSRLQYGHGFKFNSFTANGLAAGARESLAINATEEANVTLYPNPTSGSVTVGLPSEADAIISILDLAGKITTSQATSGTNAQTVGVSHLAAGIYVVKIVQAQKTYFAKLIVE